MWQEIIYLYVPATNDFFVRRRQKGILGNNLIVLTWNSVAYQHTSTTTYKWEILQQSCFLKKIPFAIFLSGPSPPAKTLHEKQTDLSAYTLGGRGKKKACGICLVIFQRGSETGAFKGSCQFSSSGWMRLNMPLRPQLENNAGTNMASLCLLWNDLEVKESQLQ